MKKYYKKILFFVSFAILFIPVFSQNNVIYKGKILNSSTKKPIKNVTIKLPEQNIMTSSNRKGEFVIKANNKNQTVFFSHIGYNNKNISLLLIDTDQPNIIYLQKKNR